jgi:hypothetical protein
VEVQKGFSDYSPPHKLLSSGVAFTGRSDVTGTDACCVLNHQVPGEVFEIE